MEKLNVDRKSKKDDSKRKDGNNDIVCYKCNNPRHIRTKPSKLTRRKFKSKEKAMAAEET